MHPKINRYSVIDVITKGENPDHLDVFIGKIDGLYHLLGYRPRNARVYFSESECSSLDIGIVELSEGKKSLSELVKGDIIYVKNHEGKPGELNGVIYQGLI